MPWVENGPGSLNKLLEDVYNQCIEQRGSKLEKDQSVCSAVAWSVAKKHGWAKQPDGTWAMGLGHNVHESGVMKLNTPTAPLLNDNPGTRTDGSILPTVPTDVVTPDLSPITFPNQYASPNSPQVDRDRPLIFGLAEPGSFVERDTPGRTVSSDRDELNSPPFNGPGAQRAAVGDACPGGISDGKNIAQMGLLDTMIAIPDKSLSTEDLVKGLRTDVAGEQETIAIYDAQAEHATDPHAAAAIREIADDERRHVGTLSEIINSLSEADRKLVEEGRKEFAARVETVANKMCAACETPCTPEERVAKFAHLPWDKCIAQVEGEGHGAEAAAKICGSIRAKNG